MIRVRVPRSVARLRSQELVIDSEPANLGELLAALENLHPGLGSALDSAAVNAAVNGEIILSGRDKTRIRDGDEVEFLVMFAGG